MAHSCVPAQADGVPACLAGHGGAADGTGAHVSPGRHTRLGRAQPSKLVESMTHTRHACRCSLQHCLTTVGVCCLSACTCSEYSPASLVCLHHYTEARLTHHVVGQTDIADSHCLLFAFIATFPICAKEQSQSDIHCSCLAHSRLVCLSLLPKDWEHHEALLRRFCKLQNASEQLLLSKKNKKESFRNLEPL